MAKNESKKLWKKTWVLSSLRRRPRNARTAKLGCRNSTAVTRWHVASVTVTFAGSALKSCPKMTRIHISTARIRSASKSCSKGLSEYTMTKRTIERTKTHCVNSTWETSPETMPKTTTKVTLSTTLLIFFSMTTLTMTRSFLDNFQITHRLNFFKSLTFIIISHLVEYFNSCKAINIIKTVHLVSTRKAQW